MNGEGYKDPTADRAIAAAGRLPGHVWSVVKAVDKVLSLVNLELCGIKMRDRETGRRYEWGK